MRSSLFFLILAAACTDPQTTARLSPAEGQTHIPLNQPLFIEGAFVYAEDYPLPDVIQVFELGSPIPVEGELIYSPTGIQFVATDYWKTNTPYIWTVREPLPEVRQPVLVLPDTVYGSASFSTGDRPLLLAGAKNPAGDLCVISSQPLSLPLQVQVAVRGEQIPLQDGRILTPVELGEIDLPDGDEGLGGFCVPLHVDWDSARVSLEGSQLVVDGSTNQAPNFLVQALRRTR